MKPFIKQIVPFLNSTLEKAREEDSFLRERKIIEWRGLTKFPCSFVILNEILRESSTAVVIAVESNNICQTTLKVRTCFVKVVSNNLNGKSLATPANSSQTTNNNPK